MDDLKREFAKKEGEPLTLSYKINVEIIFIDLKHPPLDQQYHHHHDQVLVLNVLWSVTCGRKLHPQQQEFQVRLVVVGWNDLCTPGCHPDNFMIRRSLLSG